MEQSFYLGFSIFPGIGPAKFQLLLKKFGSAEKAWNESLESLSAVLGEKLALEFDDFRKRFDLEKYAKELEEKRIGWVSLIDEGYPRLLRKMSSASVILSETEDLKDLEFTIQDSRKILHFVQNDSEEVVSSERFHPNPFLKGEGKNEIAASASDETRNDEEGLKLKKHHPPFVLFYKGNARLFREEKTIGVVGTRSITQYGREVTEMLTRELVEQGFVIVSGLALGVDGVAHETCLQTGGKTIAVLGSGVDICTPSNHQKLYDRILAEESLIVSTVPPGEEPNKGSFPARNKIIAGLSLGVIVTEGAVDSGILYTADFAKVMGRPFFSVPGPITSRLSAATTGLLKDGAIPITSAEDVVDSLGIIAVSKSQTSNSKIQKGDTVEEQEILDLLQIEPLHFNEIVRKIGKDSSILGSLLTLMELKGMVRSLGDGKYSIG